MPHDKARERALAEAALDNLIGWLALRYEGNAKKVNQVLVKVLGSDNVFVRQFTESGLFVVVTNLCRKHGLFEDNVPKLSVGGRR